MSQLNQPINNPVGVAISEIIIMPSVDKITKDTPRIKTCALWDTGANVSSTTKRNIELLHLNKHSDGLSSDVPHA